jgi:hypothetical protein
MSSELLSGSLGGSEMKEDMRAERPEPARNLENVTVGEKSTASAHHQKSGQLEHPSG